MQTTKLLIYLAVWKRPYITEICFNGINRLRTHPDYDIQAVAAISEESMIPLCEKYSIDWVMVENTPLGAKKNKGLQYCKQFDFDYLMEIGSDDLITNELLTHYKPYLKHGFIGVKDLAYLDSKTGECVRIQSNNSTYGAGRIISREYLEKAGWTLWKDYLNRGMDNNSIFKFAGLKVGYKMVPPMETPGVIDIKSDVNIWKFNGSLGKPYEKEKLFKYLSAVEVEMIEKCYT